MILKAVEELARVLCEVSPSGGSGGMQVLLTEEQWMALGLEMHRKAAMSRTLQPSPDVDEPSCVRLYTPGGEVTIRRAS